MIKDKTKVLLLTEMLLEAKARIIALEDEIRTMNIIQEEQEELRKQAKNSQSEVSTH